MKWIQKASKTYKQYRREGGQFDWQHYLSRLAELRREEG